MKLLSILILLLAVSCNNKTTCKADGDCSGTQVCGASGSCIAQTTGHCRTNDACGGKGTCDQTKKQCSCGSQPDCGTGYVCSTGFCAQSCTGSGMTSSCTQPTQTCQSNVCLAQTTANCRTDAVCTTALTGCINGACAPRRRVFLTSFVFTPGVTFVPKNDNPFNGTFNGAPEADMACSQLASNAKLTGNWMAWLATLAKTAIDRVGISPTDSAAVVMVDTAQTKVATSMADFNSASHTVAINVYETGALANEGQIPYAWTGNDLSASRNVCSDWGNSGSTLKGTAGTIFTPATWQNSGTSQCNTQNRLYCIEVN